VVVRIDVARIRRTLGPGVLDALRAASGVASADDRLFARALARADTVWIATRDLRLIDNVIVMRGRFSELDPRDPPASPPWQSASDIGGAWRRHERAQPAERAAPARLYLQGEDLLVLVSAVEIDAVERRLEGRSRSSAIKPAATGVLSFAARGPRLAAALPPSAKAAARWLGDASMVRASADLSSTEASFELEFEFESAERARLAADAVALLSHLVGKRNEETRRVLETLNIEAVEAVLVVRGKLPLELLVGLSETGRGSDFRAKIRAE
jgi:hypothetical protein